MKHNGGKGKPSMKKHNESLKKVIKGKGKPKPRGTVVPGGMAPDSKG